MNLAKNKVGLALLAVPMGAALSLGTATGASADQSLQPAATCTLQGGGGNQCTLTAQTPASTTAAAAAQGALNWAASLEGSMAWDGWCLAFVEEAYRNGGQNISSLAGDDSSAIAFWNSYQGTRVTDPNATAPAGALLFWAPTATNEYGHVALARGNGHAWSSEERSYTGVHDLTVAYRNEQGYQYLGYIVP